MNIHYLQHVEFENLGSMEPYLLGKGHNLYACHVYNGDELPQLDDFDMLIIMGGPMGVGDCDKYPWLQAERLLIKSAIEAGKAVLGICLGAQLIASALGAKVYKGRHREIGFFDINRHNQAAETFLSHCWPQKVKAFHWHGDTFDIPAGAKQLAFSEACENQGFVYNNCVALQFHLETTVKSAQKLIDNCSDELDGSRFVQSAAQIMESKDNFAQINKLMGQILDAIELNS